MIAQLVVVVLSTLLLATSTSDALCQSTGQGCLRASYGRWACHGRRTGLFQACEGCTFYHVCANGYLVPNMPCPQTEEGGVDGRLVFQQTSYGDGECLFQSTTCQECVDTPATADAAAPPDEAGVVEGGEPEVVPIAAVQQEEDEVPGGKRSDIFQRFMEELVDKRAQEEEQQEQQIEEQEGSVVEQGVDVDQRYHHETCSTGPNCLQGQHHYRCSILGDGDYQDCSSCTLYHTCVNGNIYAYRRCPTGLVWEQTSVNAGICQQSSTTCKLQCWKK